ncbi:MAG: hypothetical protein ABR555_01560 [Pyrinomonadaceae bacterium]
MKTINFRDVLMSRENFASLKYRAEILAGPVPNAAVGWFLKALVFVSKDNLDQRNQVNDRRQMTAEN